MLYVYGLFSFILASLLVYIIEGMCCKIFPSRYCHMLHSLCFGLTNMPRYLSYIMYFYDTMCNK